METTPDTFPVFKYMYIYIYIEPPPLSDVWYLEPSEKKKSTDFVGAGSFFGVGQGKLLMMHFEKD